MKTYIVIPAYNEEKNISKVIASLKEHGYEDIIVVDDGSIDSTYQILESLPVNVLHHTVNRGMGAALQTGNEYALSQEADIIVHFDADGQMQAQDIEKIILPIENKEVEITLGTRFKDNSSQLPWTKKYLLLPVSRVINYFFTGLWLSDAHNGFRALSKIAAQQIFIQQDGMAHNSEITEQINLKKISFKEIPVTILYHEYGQGLGGAFKILRDLIIGKIFR